MQMRFIQVILTAVNKINIITAQVHVKSYVGMMGRVIIHQWNKQANNVNQSQERKKKNIKAV